MDVATSARAREKISWLVCGYMAAQAIGAAARLGLFDLIGDGERSAAELAEHSGTHSESVHRLLRALAALEVLDEQRPGHFSLTDSGALLCTDRFDSLDAFARMYTDPTVTRAWQRLDDGVLTGRVVFDEEFGTDFFSYSSSDRELSALFNSSMSQATTPTAVALAEAYDFGRFDTIVDVGGGDGILLSVILRNHPSLRGILFDTPAGLAEAAATLRQHTVDARCSTIPGDFFAAVPGGGDVYLLKSIVHDWDDARAAVILGHCRSVIPDDGRLLLVERVLPGSVDGSVPASVYLSDLNMLVNVGGRERTRADFDQLCRSSGFILVTIAPLPPPVPFWVIEARPTA